MSTVPVIETGRLILRGHRLDDFEGLAAMWADPGVTRFIGGKASTREESWARLCRYMGFWPLLGYGYWRVEVKGDRRYAGDVGFFDFKREMTPSLEGLPEAGWAFMPWVHGQGIATEAVQAMLAWGDKNFADKTTVCIIGPENAPSIRVAETCGYKEIARTHYKGAATLVFRR